MNNSKSKLKRKSLNRMVLIKEPKKAYIQPFKQTPSLGGKGVENADRINAHELFEHYTAEIIKEDTIFTR